MGVDEPRDGTVRRGEVLTLVQRSLRRPGAAVIRTTQWPLSSWRRSGRWHRWTIATGEADLLHVTAAQGFLRSWARITVQRDLPEQAAVLLGVISGFLALRELQAEVDASAAVGGFVAATGSG
jgi:hypothetical protein